MSFERGGNSDDKLITLKVDFSRTTGPISTKLDDNYKKVLSSTSLLYLRMRYIILKITSVNLPMLNSRPFYLNENGALSICFNGPVCCFKDTQLGTMVGIMEKKNLHFHFFLSKDQRQ